MEQGTRVRQTVCNPIMLESEASAVLPTWSHRQQINVDTIVGALAHLRYP